MKQIKLFLNKNGYIQELVNKTTKLYLKNLDRTKTIGPEICIVTLKVPFIYKTLELLKIDIKHLMRITYYAVNSRIVFTTIDTRWLRSSI